MLYLRYKIYLWFTSLSSWKHAGCAVVCASRSTWIYSYKATLKSERVQNIPALKTVPRDAPQLLRKVDTYVFLKINVYKTGYLLLWNVGFKGIAAYS